MSRAPPRNAQEIFILSAWLKNLNERNVIPSVLQKVCARCCALRLKVLAGDSTGAESSSSPAKKTLSTATSSQSGATTVEVTSASENFRHKTGNTRVVTSIVRRPESVASDEAAKTRDETEELSAMKIEGGEMNFAVPSKAANPTQPDFYCDAGIGAAFDSYYQPYSATVYNNLNSIVRAARSYVC
jgi:hypothetical protein